MVEGSLKQRKHLLLLVLVGAHHAPAQALHRATQRQQATVHRKPTTPMLSLTASASSTLHQPPAHVSAASLPAALDAALQRMRTPVRAALTREADALNERSRRPILLSAAAAAAVALKVRKLGALLLAYLTVRLAISGAMGVPDVRRLVRWRSAYQSGAQALACTYTGAAHALCSASLVVLGAGTLVDLGARRFSSWLLPTLSYIVADWRASIALAGGSSPSASPRRLWRARTPGVAEVKTDDVAATAHGSDDLPLPTPLSGSYLEGNTTKLAIVRSAGSLSLMHLGLGLASMLWAAEALFLAELALLQRLYLTTRRLGAAAVAQGRRLRQYMPTLQRQAAETWGDLPKSFEELSQSFNYQANLVGLQTEQAMTRVWSSYLKWRQKTMRSSSKARRSQSAKPDEGWSAGVASAVGDWWDERVVTTQGAWVRWQINSAKQSKSTSVVQERDGGSAGKQAEVPSAKKPAQRGALEPRVTDDSEAAAEHSTAPHRFNLKSQLMRILSPSDPVPSADGAASLAEHVNEPKNSGPRFRLNLWAARNVEGESRETD